MKCRHQNSSELPNILTCEQINANKSIIQFFKKKKERTKDRETSDRSYTKADTVMHMEAKPSCGSQLLQHAGEGK